MSFKKRVFGNLYYNGCVLELVILHLHSRKDFPASISIVAFLNMLLMILLIILRQPHLLEALMIYLMGQSTNMVLKKKLSRRLSRNGTNLRKRFKKLDFLGRYFPMMAIRNSAEIILRQNLVRYLDCLIIWVLMRHVFQLKMIRY